ncbi:hypothetical protein UPYG_G00082050, partial [Umbra pygmaea]
WPQCSFQLKSQLCTYDPPESDLTIIMELSHHEGHPTDSDGQHFRHALIREWMRRACVTGVSKSPWDRWLVAKDCSVANAGQGVGGFSPSLDTGV